jgi:DNA-binding GntR family transcriptional regulator
MSRKTLEKAKGDNVLLARIDGPRNLAESVYIRIEEAITNLTLKPGDEIQEVKLAKQLGTSVTPVREALSRLVGDGLIVREPNKRPRVAKFSYKEIEDLYDIRGALESLGIYLAASHITSDDIASLRQLQKQGSIYVLSRKIEEYKAYNAHFHQSILNISHNVLLAEMMETIRKKIVLFVSSTVLIPGRSEQGIKEHAEMINLLEKRDASAAREAMRNHIELAKEGFLSNYQKNASED